MTASDLESLIEDARPEQRAAIRSLDPWITVSAGAGAGKTRTLASRFAWLLASDTECRADQILTLTFTNAAASEMRERIRNTLEEWHARGVSHLRDALDRLDEAYISTIHSFALRVLRESGAGPEIDKDAPIAGKPMEYEFIQDLKWCAETGSLERFTDLLTEEWSGYARSVLGNPHTDGFFDYYGAENLARLGLAACDLFGSMDMSPSDLRRLGSEAELEAQKRIARAMSARWRAVWDTWLLDILPRVCRGIGGGKASGFSAAILDFYLEWSAAERSSESERRFFVSLMQGPLRRLPSKDKVKTAVEDALGESLSLWREERKLDAELSSTLFCGASSEENEARAKDLLHGVTSLFWMCWDRTRKTRGALSFSDFTRYAVRVLKEDPSYSSRFRHVMIDEFQDTDELQDGIIRSVAASWPQDRETPRTVFIVGDIKQSIYRFRHANPRIFASHLSASSRIEMSHSFRMSGPLMERVNMIFGHIWRDGVINDEGMKVAYESLRPPEDAPWWAERCSRSCDSPVEILTYSSRSSGLEKESAANARKNLASLMVSRLSELMSGGTEIWDRENMAFRKLKWSDMTVLVKGRTSYPQLEEAFMYAGVPVSFASGRDYLNRGEVRDMICLLRCLDMPEDEQALAGWLESPFSGLEPGVGLELAAARKERTTLREALSLAYPEVSSRLELFRRTSRLYSPSAALRMLLEEDFWLSCYSGESKIRARANIRRGVEILGEYENSAGKNFSSCADYLRLQMRSGVMIEEPEPAGDGRDAVRVMTIHASKGLEFPVVILMYMESSEKADSRRRGKVSVSRSLGAVASKLPGDVKSVRKMWHDAVERIESAEESTRLLYVAMTRAQERLICCALPDGKDKKGLDWFSLLEAANEAGGFPISARDTVPGEINAGKPAPCRETVSRKPEPPPSAPFAPYSAVLSATAYSLLSWCPEAYRIRYRQGRELKWNIPAKDGTGGADLGSLVHWVLSRWDFREKTVAEFLPENADAADATGMPDAMPQSLRAVFFRRPDRLAAKKWLESFSRRESCLMLRKALESGRMARELSFSVDCDGINLIGSMDVFWEDELGCHVRDWKITPEGTAPHEMYAAQTEFYAMACHITHPASDTDTGLIYLRPAENGFPETSIVENWDELSLRIKRAAFAAVRSPGRSERCGVCHFRDYCSNVR
ncbi:MAG: UvrD-helicase domain-containing protein [Synergistaceae bacterium]|jgi:ATP-dependent exoDNAse (exonuclease V) beta subunit|nr:UvrD-helicase domain-containing protein [Synergistaceae bacterium]